MPIFQKELPQQEIPTRVQQRRVIRGREVQQQAEQQLTPGHRVIIQNRGLFRKVQDLLRITQDM